MYQFWQTGVKSQSIDICSFLFNYRLQERVKTFDQHVHDLNPKNYVLCSNVLFLSHYAEAGSKPDCFIP